MNKYTDTIRKKCAQAAKWYKGLYTGSKWYVKIATALVSLFLLFAAYLVAVDTNLLWLFGKSPGFSSIKDPVTYQASEIYSADGVQIGKFFSVNRTPVSYEEVNPAFWQVLIDTEDERFYRHLGIDVAGIFAAAKDAIMHDDARGASTITQQLAKNMFKVRTDYSTGLLGKIPGLRLLIMKSKEWIIATKLEMLYSKQEILTMYANTVSFGSNAYGIKTASKTYFDTTPDRLNTQQSAVLVGMLKATTTYNPISHPDNSLKRRNIVLANLLRKKHITEAEYDSLTQLPMGLNYNVETNYDGQAQYFREAVGDNIREWCKDNGYDLYRDGLKIYTTLDSRMQRYAEEAAISQMRQIQRSFNSHWQGMNPWADKSGKEIKGFIERIAQREPYYKYLHTKYDGNRDSINHYLNKPHKVKLFDYANGHIYRDMSTLDSIRYMVRFMHCSIVAMEPQTGAVKAYVGDIDFSMWKYDKARGRRQPGSTFKLFVYTEAMNQGLTPCDKRRDEPLSMKVYDPQQKKEITWSPSNANGYFTYDSIPLKNAFARSINSVAVRLGQELGIRRVAATARAMGITSKLDETPSLALGASDVSLLELVSAYSTIAAGGMHHTPMLVTRIEDNKGRTVYVDEEKPHPALSRRTAFFMQRLLCGGLTEPGATSMSLRGYVDNYPDSEWGGKTGTSNNHSDAWFMAISPQLVVGSWVGGEYRSIHFRTGALGQGSRTALPICGRFIKRVLANKAFKRYQATFPKPDDPEIKDYMYSCRGYTHTPRNTASDDDSLFVYHAEEIGENLPTSAPVSTGENITEGN